MLQMEKIKVLVAVKSFALARVIQHVLHGQAGISRIDFADSGQGLMEQAERLRPSLIIVNSRLLGRDAGTALTQLKRANPQSKLILIGNFEELSRGIDSGILDARVLDETLVQQLPAITRRLANRPRAKSSIVHKFSLVLALFVLSFPGSAFAQRTDSAKYAPPNYYNLPPPAAGNSYVDPVFGSTIKRMSNSLVEPNLSSGSGTLPFISVEYSTMSPFNSGNSRILGLHFSYFGLYDGSGRFTKNLNVCASCEPRWSRTDPYILYFISGNQLKRLDVSTDAVSVVHTFSEYASISGKGESDISADGNHFVFAGDARSVFVYEISTDTKGPVFDTAGRGFDSLYITPNNNVTITWFQPGTARYNGIELFDRNMTFQRQAARAGGHMDVTSDTNGDEILLWTNSGDPTPICSNAIVKVRLSDAHETCLISLDWSLAVHVSAADSGGWFFMETYAPGDPAPDSAAWKPYTNEILQVKLDGTEVRRLTHHRSRPFDGYNYTPRASTSRDGSRIIFNSNFGLYGPSTLYTDSYLMVLSASATAVPATPVPIPVPVSVPVPVPVPIPVPVPVPAPAPVPAWSPIRTSQVQTSLSGPANMQVGYGAIDTGMGVAVLRSFSGQDLVSEAAIPASAAANNWIMYAEQGARVSTGVAIANPNNIDVNVDLLLSDGRQTLLPIPAMGQHAAFVNEIFGNFQGSFLGTLKIQSNSPVAVLALRGTTNAEGQFIIASIPLNSGVPDIGGTKVFPSVVDGGGYNSELILVNSASTVSAGTIQFSFDVPTGLGANRTFHFSIPAGGVWRIGTMGLSGTVTSGYASLIMSGGSPMPDATAIIRLSSNGNLISETAVPAQSQVNRSLMFGSFKPNSRTGVAIVNPLPQDVQVTLTPFDGNGGSAAPARTMTLRALSQTSAFLDELIGGIPSGFAGSVLLEAASPVYAISMRGTTNSSGGFLMSTLSMVDLNQAPSGMHYFPHVVNGGLYKTEFLIMNTGTSSPQLSLFNTDGKPMAITLQ